MYIHIDFDFGIKETIRDFSRFINEQICKRKGHIWEEYEEEDFWPISNFNFLFPSNKVLTHTCKRCHAGKYKKKDKNKKGSVLKIPKYSDLKK